MATWVDLAKVLLMRMGMSPEDHRCQMIAEFLRDDIERVGQVEVREKHGELDEVCANGPLHLEQMDTNHWWMSVGGIHVNLTARGKIKASWMENTAPPTRLLKDGVLCVGEERCSQEDER